MDQSEYAERIREATNEGLRSDEIDVRDMEWVTMRLLEFFGEVKRNPTKPEASSEFKIDDKLR